MLLGPEDFCVKRENRLYQTPARRNETDFWVSSIHESRSGRGSFGLIAVRVRLCFRRLLALAAPLGRPYQAIVSSQVAARW